MRKIWMNKKKPRNKIEDMKSRFGMLYEEKGWFCMHDYSHDMNCICVCVCTICPFFFVFRFVCSLVVFADDHAILIFLRWIRSFYIIFYNMRWFCFLCVFFSFSLELPTRWFIRVVCRHNPWNTYSFSLLWYQVHRAHLFRLCESLHICERRTFYCVYFDKRTKCHGIYVHHRYFYHRIIIIFRLFSLHTMNPAPCTRYIMIWYVHMYMYM